MQVGDEVKSNNFGTFVVLEIDGENSTVKFKDTGTIARSRTSNLRTGSVADYGLYPTVKVGDLFKSAIYGQMEVLSVIDARHLEVRFVSTGYTTTAQKWAVLSGLVKDKKAKEVKADEAEALRKAEISRKEEEQKEETNKRKRIKASIISLVSRFQKAKKDFTRKTIFEEKEGTLKGTYRTDKMGFEFCVLHLEALKGSWKIRYTDSGNEYVQKEKMIIRGSVFDKDRLDFSSLKEAYDKKVAVEWYERNRDAVKEKASSYQKNNLEKARVRNQNRRARRKNAEGSHTLEELDAMMVAQDGKCNCCGERLTKDNKHLDHVMPLSLGGTNYIDNLQWLCQFCNNSKAGRHPDDWQAYCSTEEFKQRRQARMLQV